MKQFARYGLLLLSILPTALVAQGVTVVSSASFAADYPVAPDSIASAFGTNLAASVEAAVETPLRTTLANTSVTIIDSAGQSHDCPLFYVSPGQINFLVPPQVALGAATIQVNSGGVIQTGQVEIAAVSTGLYTVTDLEWLSGFILQVDADGTQTLLPTVELNDGNIVPVPLQMSPNGDESAAFYLILYGTGNRGSGELSSALTYIGFDDGVGADNDIIPTIYNAAQPDFVGLDQTNAGPIPRRLEWYGGGDRATFIRVDGDASNLAWINVAPNPNAPVIANPSIFLTQSDPPQVTTEVDFEDADGDLGPFGVVWIWEDESQYCFSSANSFDTGWAGQTSGRIQTSQATTAGVQLGEVVSVAVSLQDARGHVSNIIEFNPTAGALRGFFVDCAGIVEKE